MEGNTQVQKVKSPPPAKLMFFGGAVAVLHSHFFLCKRTDIYVFWKMEGSICAGSCCFVAAVYQGGSGLYLLQHKLSQLLLSPSSTLPIFLRV